MEKIKLGFCMTGSFCTFDTVIVQMKELAKEYTIIPIMSYHSYQTDTRFGKAKDFIQQVEEITGHSVIHDLPGAEPIGPTGMTDLMLVAPCTGNTLAKLSMSITDTPVTMAVKSHLRNQKPVVIAVSTNDALSGCAKNIGTLLNLRHYYFVPYRQDNPSMKNNSMVADFSKIAETLQQAYLGKQIQPMITS